MFQTFSTYYYHTINITHIIMRVDRMVTGNYKRACWLVRSVSSFSGIKVLKLPDKQILWKKETIIKIQKVVRNAISTD